MSIKKIRMVSFKKNELVSFLKNAKKYYSKNYIFFYSHFVKVDLNSNLPLNNDNGSMSFKFSYSIKRKLRKSVSRNRQRRRIKSIVLDFLKKNYMDVNTSSECFNIVLLEFRFEILSYEILKKDLFYHLSKIHGFKKKLSNEKSV